MSTTAHSKPKGLCSEIRQATGNNPARCYQCGKCSAGCPMSEEMSLNIHDIMRLVIADERERLIGSDSIWLCLTCETCTARCPNQCDPARVVDALREIAINENPGAAPKAILAFHQSFLDQIRSHGRLFEVGLVMKYKLKGGPLFQNVFEAPSMFTRGKLGLSPHRIQNIDEIKRIFKACSNKQEETI